MAYTAQREQAALATQRARRLSPVSLPSGKWGVRDKDGLAPDRGEYDDPVLAIEAADAAITSGEQREAATKLEVVASALDQGNFSPWPQTAPDGSIRWLVLRTSDRSVASGPWGGWRAAAVDVSRLEAAAVAARGAAASDR